MIYLDDASTSFPKPPSVHEAMLHGLRDVGANPGRGGYASARAADRLVYETRNLAADFFGAVDSARVVFTPGCTYSLNMALKGLLKAGDHVVVCGRQHNAVVRPLASVNPVVSNFDWDGRGPFEPKAFSRLLKPETKAVVVNHASNVDGLLFPLDELRDAANGVPLVIDCAQTAGVVEIRTGDRDVVCAPGHKGLWGAAGVGILAFGKKIELEPVVVGGTGSFSEDAGAPPAYPDRLEPGTMNLPGIAALGAGMREVGAVGVANVFRKKMALALAAYERLSKIRGVKIFWPDDEARRVPLFSFTVEGLDPSEAADLLDRDHGIACRSGLHCAPRAHMELGTFPVGTVRFAPGYFNVPGDVDAFAAAVVEMAKKG